MIAEVLPRGNRKSSMCSMHACHDQFHKDEMSNHGFLRTSAPTLRPFLCQCLAFHRCPHKGYSQSKWQRSWCSKGFDLIILICMHQKVFCLHYIRPPNPQHPAPDSTLHWYLFKVARVVTLEVKNITIYRSINSIFLRSVLFRGSKVSRKGNMGGRMPSPSRMVWWETVFRTHLLIVPRIFSAVTTFEASSGGSSVCSDNLKIAKLPPHPASHSTKGKVDLVESLCHTSTWICRRWFYIKQVQHVFGLVWRKRW